MAPRLKCLPGMRETWVWFLGWEDPLEKELATHSSTFAWRIPWKEEPGRLQSMGLQRVGHDWATSLHFEVFGIISVIMAGLTWCLETCLSLLILFFDIEDYFIYMWVSGQRTYLYPFHLIQNNHSINLYSIELVSLSPRHQKQCGHRAVINQQQIMLIDRV